MNELNWYDIAWIIFFAIIIVLLASNNNKPTDGTATT
jgi:hypothetical protein